MRKDAAREYQEVQKTNAEGKWKPTAASIDQHPTPEWFKDAKLGMFIDWVAILLVTLPVFMPISMELDFDPLWFSMLICVILQTSFLTPPFGYSLFYFAGAASKDYSMSMIYKGVMPFIVLQLIGVLLCLLFPSLITYLPSLWLK